MRPADPLLPEGGEALVSAFPDEDGGVAGGQPVRTVREGKRALPGPLVVLDAPGPRGHDDREWEAREVVLVAVLAEVIRAREARVARNLALVGAESQVDYEQFAQVYRRLSRAGYELEPEAEAWRAFARARASYAGRLQALADYWATPATVWVGHGAVTG
jgi:hypothetical protein